jgi:hypothetical protein
VAVHHFEEDVAVDGEQLGDRGWFDPFDGELGWCGRFGVVGVVGVGDGVERGHRRIRITTTMMMSRRRNPEPMTIYQINCESRMQARTKNTTPASSKMACNTSSLKLHLSGSAC